ncbi:alkaline phosphatase, partial [Pseudomonas aeruginosa]
MTGLKNKNDVISMPTGTLAKEPKDLKLANGQSIHNAINLCQPRIPEQTVPSLLELAIQRGKAVGVVTTAELTHATPAATYAHICHRDAKFDIAVQAVPNGLGYNPKL